MKGFVLGLVVLLSTMAMMGIWLIPTDMSSPAVHDDTPTIDTSGNPHLLFEVVGRNDLFWADGLLKQNPNLARQRGLAHGELPLHQARSIEMAKLLLAAGADITARDTDFRASAARWALNRRAYELAGYLDGVKSVDDDPYYLAGMGRAGELRRMLAENPGIVHERTLRRDVLGGNWQMLHLAATHGQMEVARLLLQSGADVNATGGRTGSTPLENAALAGFPEMVALLLEHGAALEARDLSAGRTALWYAAIYGRDDVVQLLLNAGAAIDEGLLEEVRNAMENPLPLRNPASWESYMKVLELLQKQTEP